EREELDRLRASAEELELEFKATQRLYELLTEAEAKQAAHLGRILAKPVTARFLELTGNRYADVILNPDLTLRKIVAQGDERDPMAFSGGERAQLATLIRLELAANLHSMLLLDDQLKDCDPDRMRWFRDRLRASVRDHGHQIIVFTDRPGDYLDSHELPQSSSPSLSSDGLLAVIELDQVISHH
ncbi:MAG TPA: hypothetical protein VK137_09805, partial [Planctomycetaceae bacterium]|nr:hypothetical protein [Planctomycetaceae bacterium]